jgi:hypothetical protein
MIRASAWCRAANLKAKACSQTPGGRGCGSRSPQAHSSGAGAQPEQAVCEQAVALSSGWFGFYWEVSSSCLRESLWSTSSSNLLSAGASDRRACIMTYSGRGRGTSTLNLEVGFFFHPAAVSRVRRSKGFSSAQEIFLIGRGSFPFTGRLFSSSGRALRPGHARWLCARDPPRADGPAPPWLSCAPQRRLWDCGAALRIGAPLDSAAESG